jgi:exonuclease III
MHETPATSVVYVTQGVPTPEVDPPKDPSTPSNRPRDNLFTLDMVSHNVNGAKERLSADMTRTATKLKTIAAHMLKYLIDIYHIQETWLEGSEDFAIGEITFLMHTQEKQQGRGRGVVVIALSKKARKAWDKAGNTIIKPDVAGDGTVRMMFIDIAVPSNKTWETISIFNVYAPPIRL